MYFISNWNGLLWPPIICSNRSMDTLAAELARFTGQPMIEYGLVMADSSAAIAPMVIAPMVIALLLIERVVEGIATSGIR